MVFEDGGLGVGVLIIEAVEGGVVPVSGGFALDGGWAVVGEFAEAGHPVGVLWVGPVGGVELEGGVWHDMGGFIR